MDGDQGACGDASEASLLRARLSAILDTTLDPLILARPVRDDRGEVVDFVIADMNGSHARAGGDRSTADRMHLPDRCPDLFGMYQRVLRAGTTEFVRRTWVDAHPQDPTSTPGWADVRATGVADDVVILWRNVDADVAAEALLRSQAMQDSLTHLPNRRGLMEALAGACAGDDAFGVLFVDIDAFKSVNDRYGHASGDAVLVSTGRRLTSVLRDDDIVGRWAGDEFVVLARHLHDRAELRALAERLLAAGAHAHHVGPQECDEIQVSVSVGGLWVAADARHDVAELLHAADGLMYRAKREGGSQFHLDVLPRPDELPTH